MLGVLLGGAPVKAQSDDTQRVTQQLFDAVYGNDLAAAQAAIAAGAAVDSRDAWGMTPIDLAVNKGYYRLAHFLMTTRTFQRGEKTDTAGTPPAAPAAPAALAPGTAKPATAPNRSVQGRPDPAPGGSPGGPQEPAPAPWSANVPNPFDPSTPVPGSDIFTGAPPPAPETVPPPAGGTGAG